MKHSVNSHPPLLFHHKNAAEEYQFTTHRSSIYLHACVCVCVCVCARARAHASSLASVSFQICSLVKYIFKQRTAHNHMLHSGHLNIVLIFFVYRRTHKAPNFLPFQ